MVLRTHAKELGVEVPAVILLLGSQGWELTGQLSLTYPGERLCEKKNPTSRMAPNEQPHPQPMVDLWFPHVCVYSVPIHMTTYTYTTVVKGVQNRELFAKDTLLLRM